jgi:hypothetical protein
MSRDYGITIFCDDIREELNNKKTLVGAYADDLLVTSGFPIVLPVLGLLVTLLEPIGSTDGPLNLKVYVPGERDDEVVIDLDLPENRASLGDSLLPDPSAEYLSSIISLRLSPLLIRKEGRIKVRAYKRDHEIRLGTLLVTSRVAEQDDVPEGG